MTARRANALKVSEISGSGLHTSDSRQAAERLVAMISETDAAGGEFRLTRSDGRDMTLPPLMVGVLETAAEFIASGSAVLVLPTEAELTSQEAATILGVSRQYLVRLLDRGDIPSSRVGAHRRVKVADLAAYQAKRDRDREIGLDILVAEAQVCGGYDEPMPLGPPRKE